MSPGNAMTEYTRVDGHRVAYEVVGEGEPTLLFVHGWSAERGQLEVAKVARRTASGEGST